jgi:glycosyltransferase involved in cell wall biosynthesis
MKRILIISYFFPPGNFAGSYRIQAWAEHLRKFGYYPIVVTRHWNENETDYTAISDQKEITKEENEKFTVYRLPYKGSLRDRLIKRFGNKAKFFGKILSFFQVIGQNYFLSSVPYRNLYDFSRHFIKDNPDTNIVITSGRPFVQFRFCYLLKKEFPQIQWIADYRDPWNSCSNINDNIKARFLRIFEKPLEKRWLKNAAFFSSTSKGFVDGINTILEQPKGYVITNGFSEFIDISQNFESSDLTIAYVGSLYHQQKIEIFLEGYKSFCNKNQNAKVKLQFFGIEDMPAPKTRIERIIKEIPDKYEIIQWLQKEELIEQAEKVNAFLLCGIPERKGTYTAKLFDYFSMRKPIILCPSDNDILKETIKETETGVVLNTTEEVEVWLNNAYAYWQLHKSIPYNAKEELLLQFTYEKQVEKLAALITEKVKN